MIITAQITGTRDDQVVAKIIVSVDGRQKFCGLAYVYRDVDDEGGCRRSHWDVTLIDGVRALPEPAQDGVWYAIDHVASAEVGMYIAAAAL